MNASAPPNYLDDRHASAIARLLLILDQLLCAIGESGRLPWYLRWRCARWLVPARAARPVMAWGQAWIEALRREIMAIGEKVRYGACEDAADWEEPAWNDGRAARGGTRPGERASSDGDASATMHRGAEAASDPCEPRFAAEEFNLRDLGGRGDTPDAMAAQADSPEDGGRSG